MPISQKLTIALVLLALFGGAFVLSPAAAGPLIFLAGSIASLLWALGITRTPGHVRAKRRAAALQPRRLAEPHPQVAQRWFPEVPKRWVRPFFWVNGGVPLLLGLACFATLVFPPADKPEVRALLVLFGGGLLLYGAFFLRFAQQLPRMGVRVDPLGIDAIGILGGRRIAWDDVVAFTNKTYHMQGVDYQTNYIVYSAERSIEINGKLKSAEELVAIIEANISREP